MRRDLTDEILSNYDVLGIDEAQFDKEILTIVESIANSSKIVILAGLDGLFQRKFIGYLLDLIPMAESLKKLSAVCMKCKEKGSFTMKSEKNLEQKIVQVGVWNCSRQSAVSATMLTQSPKKCCA